MPGLRLHDWGTDPLFDSAIVSHGFVPFMRDYDVIFDVPAALPDGSGSYIEGRYRYRFTHCVEAAVETAVSPETWKRSWTDEFTQFRRWEEAGSPDGFVWGTEWAAAYPGGQYVSESERAAAWAQKLGREMHEVRIRTNAYVLTLVCHDLRVDQIASGDPATRELVPLDSG